MRYSDCHADRAHYCKGYCKECYSKSVGKRSSSRAYYLKNRENVLAKAKARRIELADTIHKKERERYISRRLNDPVHFIYMGAKSRARRNGLEFTITKEDIGILPEFCPVLGIKLLYTNFNKLKPESASLDRFDSTKGYIPGNVYIISMRANTLKSDGTIEEFKALVKYMEWKFR